MPHTRTTFRPGHKGVGGRPKGSRTGSAKLLREAKKQVIDLATQVEALVTDLLAQRNALGLTQLARRSEPHRLHIEEARGINKDIRALSGLLKVERYCLELSKNARPIIKPIPNFITRYMRIPVDPMVRDYSRPMRLLGNRPPSHFWTEEE